MKKALFQIISYLFLKSRRMYIIQWRILNEPHFLPSCDAYSTSTHTLLSGTLNREKYTRTKRVEWITWNINEMYELQCMDNCCNDNHYSVVCAHSRMHFYFVYIYVNHSSISIRYPRKKRGFTSLRSGHTAVESEYSSCVCVCVRTCVHEKKWWLK